jgi:hypothetical protein
MSHSSHRRSPRRTDRALSCVQGSARVVISHATCNVRGSHFIHLPGPFIAAMGPFRGFLTLAPGVLRPRDSASDVAGYRSLRSVTASFPLSRRTPESVDRLYSTRPLIRVAPGCHRPVEGPMVGARAVREHHPGRERVALPRGRYCRGRVGVLGVDPTVVSPAAIWRQRPRHDVRR